MCSIILVAFRFSNGALMTPVGEIQRFQSKQIPLKDSIERPILPEQLLACPRESLSTLRTNTLLTQVISPQSFALGHIQRLKGWKKHFHLLMLLNYTSRWNSGSINKEESDSIGNTAGWGSRVVKEKVMLEYSGNFWPTLTLKTSPLLWEQVKITCNPFDFLEVHSYLGATILCRQP